MRQIVRVSFSSLTTVPISEIEPAKGNYCEISTVEGDKTRREKVNIFFSVFRNVVSRFLCFKIQPLEKNRKIR